MSVNYPQNEVSHKLWRGSRKVIFKRSIIAEIHVDRKLISTKRRSEGMEARRLRIRRIASSGNTENGRYTREYIPIG